MILGEMQTHIERQINFIQSSKGIDKINAMEAYREQAKLYNNIFNGLNGKIYGDKGYEQIYDTEFRG